MIYFYIVFILALFSVFESCGLNKISCVRSFKLNKLIYIYISIFLVLISAFRYETGRDWKGYINFFEECLTTNSSWEVGFVLLNKIFKSTFNDFYVMQFVVMTFCCVIVHRSFFRKSEYPIFSILMYFFMFFLTIDMAQVRQYISIAILILGEKYIKEKKILGWIFYVILAMQFHISAICAFPLYFTTYTKVNNKIIFLLFFISLILNVFGLKITRIILSVVLSLPFLPTRISMIGSGYLESNIYGQQIQFDSGMAFCIRYIFYFIMIIVYSGKKNNTTKYFILNFIIALIFQALGRNFDVLTRVAYFYFICGGGICAFNLLIDSKNYLRGIQLFRVSFVCIFLLFNILAFYKSWITVDSVGNSYKSDYSPYKSVLFNKL